MRLHYDHNRGQYVGERLAISRALFNRAKHELVGSGMSEAEAVMALLQEEDWSLEMDGVTALDRREWPETLWFDHTTQRFTGSRLSVGAADFYRRLRRITASGVAWSEAYRRLRQEHEWTLEMPGVESAFAFDEVLAEAERLVRERAT